MRDEDFDSLVSFGERPGVEFKGPGSLTNRDFLARVARAVLALSNHRDGGVVMIGIENKTKKVVGLGDPELAEWRKSDDVLDKLGAYASPSLAVELDYEPESWRCVILHVKQFSSLPVFCKQAYQSGKEHVLRKGIFYCRPATGSSVTTSFNGASTMALQSISSTRTTSLG